MNAFAQQLDHAQQDERVVTTYTIPDSLRGQSGPKQIAVRNLYSDEELAASQAAGFQLLKSQYEATKRMIVSVDGQPVSVNNGSIDRLWERWDPKIRDLLVMLYNKMTTPSKEEADSFFKSAKTEV